MNARMWMLGLGVAVALGGCGGRSEDTLGETDPRCVSSCEDPDPACASATAECTPLCQVRVAGMSALCATCLLEASGGSPCLVGELCCPDPSYANDPLDCASVCAGSRGVNPPMHPMCDALCLHEDATCSDAVASCLSACAARARGVSGLCALCLLEGGSGSPCLVGEVCCPDATPSFARSATDCASVCD